MSRALQYDHQTWIRALTFYDPAKKQQNVSSFDQRRPKIIEEVEAFETFKVSVKTCFSCQIILQAEDIVCGGRVFNRCAQGQSKAPQVP